MQIIVWALQFDSIEAKKHEKGWNHVNMNMETLSTKVSKITLRSENNAPHT